jgi:hypothetical protein
MDAPLRRAVRSGAVNDLETLTTLWRERGVTIAEVEGGASQSLVGSDRALGAGLTRSRGGLRLDAEAALADEPLDLGAMLGRGGMGEVHRATQLTLRRDVAVKRIAARAGTAEHAAALAALLKEAWVGGNLEHPNLVPVHALGAVDGAPAVIMKRIEGVTLLRALHDPSLLPERERHDPLTFFVRTLVSVCNAVAFAHKRGVLHLDIKPENVMLGHFGEVCLLDWGLAAGFGAAAPSWLPPARETRSISGTPDYMAPEMVTADGPNLTPRTDVYLVGATLHELVTGEPPHRVGTVMQRLQSAFLSEPRAYPARVPPELVEVLHRAMHRDPRERFESAEALRDALSAFLDHRRGDAIVREAAERVEHLERAIDAGDSEDDVSRRFGAARFSLREAEDARPERTAVLHRRLFTAMAAHAMAGERIDLAATYLAALGSDAHLEARLASLREASRARQERVQALENLANQESLDVGGRFRRRVAMGLASLFVVGSGAYDALERLGVLTMGYGTMLLHTSWLLAPICAYAWWQRRHLSSNRANASVYAVALLTYVLLQVFWLVAWLLAIPFRSALAASGVFYLLAGGAVSVMISARFAASPIAAALGLLGAAALPELAWWTTGIGAALALLVVGLASGDVQEAP